MHITQSSITQILDCSALESPHMNEALSTSKLAYIIDLQIRQVFMLRLTACLFFWLNTVKTISSGSCKSYLCISLGNFNFDFEFSRVNNFYCICSWTGKVWDINKLLLQRCSWNYSWYATAIVNSKIFYNYAKRVIIFLKN